MKSKSGLEKLTRAKARLRAYVRPEISREPFRRAERSASHVSGIPLWMQCEHYGPVVQLLPGRQFACGCGEIPLHRCERYGDLVFHRLAPRTIQKIRTAGDAPDFRGRTCETCELWRPPAT